jgi:hypothetical protein
MRASNLFTFSGATVTTKRLWDSENNIVSARLMFSTGTFVSSMVIPSSPENALSARATPSPPSEQSWQEATTPSLIAFSRAIYNFLAEAAFTLGTSFPINPRDAKYSEAPSSSLVIPRT